MAEFISADLAQRIVRAWPEADSLGEAMRIAGVKSTDQRRLRRYRRMAESIMGVDLPPKHADSLPSRLWTTKKINFTGTAVIFSDCHYWPGEPSPAHQILLTLLEEIQPELVICNGDAIDAASISRHLPNGWEEKPTMARELEVARERLDEIIEASPESEHLWCVGNHDDRFDKFLARHAPELRGVPYMKIEDWFTEWEFCRALDVEDKKIRVQHKWHGGIHSSYNNVLKAGWSFVTGHTHKLNVRPWSDLSGTRYGVETGTLSHDEGQFEYAEKAPKDMQEGFVVWTVADPLPYPELVRVDGNRAYFRGHWYEAE